MNEGEPRSTLTTWRAHRVSGALCVASIVAAGWQLVGFLRVAIGRAGYPMDIDWMEGGALYHAYRLLRGQPIYGPPANGFAPFPYPPLHAIALAVVGKITTLDYTAGRALSSVCFIATLALLGFVASEPRAGRAHRVTFGLVAAGLAASSYPFVETRFDLIRNDSLALLLAVAAARTLLCDELTSFRILLGALLSTAAVFTRQTDVFFVGWLLAVTLVRNRRQGLVLAGATALLAGASLAWAMVATHGWFWTWTFTNLGAQPVRWERLGRWSVLLAAAPAFPVAAALLVVVRVRRAGSWDVLGWIGVLGAALVASLLPFAKVAGGASDLMPLAVVSPAVALRLASALVEHGTDRTLRPRAYAGIAAFAAVAMLLRVRAPGDFLPSEERRTQAEALNDTVRVLEGGVVIPNHPFIAVRNGHQNEQFHDQGYQDAMIAGMPGLDLPGFLRRVGAKWLILSGSESAPTRGWVFQVYEPSRALADMPETLVGYRSRPMELLRRRAEFGKKNVRILFDFESDAEGWQLQDTAFAHAPSGPPGHRYLTSAPSPLGDRATGRALSPTFIVDRDHLGFLIGGGVSATLSVSLRVEGRVVKQSHGVESDVLFEKDWDVHAFAGKEARLVLTDLDDGDFGRLLVARVHLFDQVPKPDGDPLPSALSGDVGPERPVRK
jgi:hypothetical protein